MNDKEGQPIVNFWNRINETDSKAIDKDIRDKKKEDADKRIKQDRGRYDD